MFEFIGSSFNGVVGMSKVSLTLVGVQAGVVEKETRKSLSELYSKPESHFDIHCQHLFQLKKPFKLINQIDAGEAELHREKLEQMGIVCEVVTLGKSGLELVPVDAKETDNSTACPACDHPSDDPEVCDSCGVIMKKFAEQRSVDEMLQKKLASADRSHERIKAAQQLEDERRKKAKAKKPGAELPPEELSDDDYEDRFTVEVEDEGKNRILYVAAAGALIAAIGGGYFAYSVNQAINAKEVDFSVAGSEATPFVKATNESHVVVVEEVESEAVVTPYSVWQSQMASIDELKHQLDALNDAVGMSSTMSGLLANVDDPLQQIIGHHYAVLIKSEKQDAAEIPGTQDSFVSEFESELDNSMLRIAALPTPVDRMCALLDLGRAFESLNLINKAELAYKDAEKAALEAMNSNDQSQIVLAEVMAAEHQIDRGQHDKGLAHYTFAADAARLDDLNSNHAMAFVALSEAGAGLFANAYNLVEEIQDDSIKTNVMDDVVRIAGQLEVDPDGLSLTVEDSIEGGGLSNEVEFADDPELMLLFENDKKMKANAAKISNLLDR